MNLFLATLLDTLGFSILFVKTEIRSNGDWVLGMDLEVCAC